MIIKNVEVTVLGIGVPGVYLLPGNNTVKNADWAKAKKNPVIKRRIDSGLIIEVVQETQTDNFSDMTATDQKKFVVDLNDLAKLKIFLDDAKTDAVKKVIRAQIEKIEEA
jgi:ribosomal protein L19E